MIAVLGVLQTDEGMRVREELLAWLRPLYEVIEVHQCAPGVRYEYPAIALACDMSYKLQEPVLYLHTKGAANVHPVQAEIRRMWKNELGNEQSRKKYLDLLTGGPKIATPIMSPVGKCTWFNAWIINKEAAEILRDHCVPSDARYDYESVARDTDIEVVSPYEPKENKAIFDLTRELANAH